VTVIKISILTTGRLARKTGQAAHSDTDNAMLVFGHATLVARALQRLPGGAAGCGGMRRNSGVCSWEEFAHRQVVRPRNRKKTTVSV
jgi:hypothetical protein